MAVAQGGTFLLRIEDIDQSRARPEWEAQIFDDLAWLGLTWETPVMRQSDRLETYQAALHRLWDQHALFACTCNRRDIAAAAAAPQEGGDPLVGPDGIVYPGTCRANQTMAGASFLPTGAALRLDSGVAASLSNSGGLSFCETGDSDTAKPRLITFSAESFRDEIGDVVLSRRDMGTSYHLSVVLDDAAQGITHVVRGRDLVEATKIHVCLQQLLGLPTPIYHHHKLIRDDTGKRLAKRDDARSIAAFRADGANPATIREMVGLT